MAAAHLLPWSACPAVGSAFYSVLSFISIVDACFHQYLYSISYPAAIADASMPVAADNYAMNQRRLAEFVKRELKAILMTDDVGIVSAYVMGLVSSHGLAAESGEAADGRGPVASLSMFLDSNAEHFWHELR